MADGRLQERSLFDPEIMRPAILESLRKLAPRHVIKNPVMFVVEIGSVLTSLILLRDLVTPAPTSEPLWFTFNVTFWLWFTVIFANFAEAVAEGRGKAQAATLRKMRQETSARRLRNGQREETVAASLLRKGDTVVVEAGEVIPGDGDVIQGIASVDESAITGESAPVIRESGGDRSAVTGGTESVVRPNRRAHYGEPRRVFPRSHDRSGGRRGAAKNPQRNRAEYFARRPYPGTFSSPA